MCDNTTEGGQSGCEKCSYSGTTFTCTACDVTSATPYVAYDKSGCIANCHTSNSACFIFNEN